MASLVPLSDKGCSWSFYGSDPCRLSVVAKNSLSWERVLYLWVMGYSPVAAESHVLSMPSTCLSVSTTRSHQAPPSAATAYLQLGVTLMASGTSGRNGISCMDTGRPAWGGSAGAEENCHWHLLQPNSKQFYCTPPSLHTKKFEVLTVKKGWHFENCSTFSVISEAGGVGTRMGDFGRH